MVVDGCCVLVIVLRCVMVLSCCDLCVQSVHGGVEVVGGYAPCSGACDDVSFSPPEGSVCDV